MVFCSVHKYENLIDALRWALKGYQIEKKSFNKKKGIIDRLLDKCHD
jgi:hypothetical protein